MSEFGNHISKDDVIEWSLKEDGQTLAAGSYSAIESSSHNKGSTLPIARVKRIMKEGEHPGMIAADAPVILAKACEMLIKDLTLQSWDCTISTRRCTLQKQDVISAIFKNHVYSFLLDILTPDVLFPKMELKTDKYIVPFNDDKVGEDIRAYKVIHGANASRNRCPRGSGASNQSQLPLSTSSLYRGITHCYVFNPCIQEQVLGSRHRHITPNPNCSAGNTVRHYNNVKHSSGNTLRGSGYVATMPLHQGSNNKSQTIVKGVTPYSEASLKMDIKRNQALQSQMSYSQQRFSLPSDHKQT